MRFKSEIVLTELGDEYVAVPVGENADRYIVKLNKTAAGICKDLIDGYEAEQIVSRLMDKYSELDEKTAKDAVADVIEKLQAEGIVEG